jgi:hypothetical protein
MPTADISTTFPVSGLSVSEEPFERPSHALAREAMGPPMTSISILMFKAIGGDIDNETPSRFVRARLQSHTRSVVEVGAME